MPSGVTRSQRHRDAGACRGGWYPQITRMNADFGNLLDRTSSLSQTQTDSFIVAVLHRPSPFGSNTSTFASASSSRNSLVLGNPNGCGTQPRCWGLGRRHVDVVELEQSLGICLGRLVCRSPGCLDDVCHEHQVESIFSKPMSGLDQ